MKSSRSLSVLLVSAGFVLTVSLSAQTPNPGASAAGSKSAASEKSPLPNPPAKPNRPVNDPTVNATPGDPKPGVGLTPGAANSGSGAGGRETVRPDLGSVNDPAGTRTPPGARKHPSAAAPQFNTMDTDRDGRISSTEFTAPSAGWLQRGSSDDSSVSGAPGTGGPLDRPSPGTMPRSNGGAPNSTAAENHAKLFQQLDTDHDGYLSPTELETYRAPTSSER